MKLSVIIPCYNEENYIERCVDSLLKQSYKEFEVVFVDDGSTDNTHKILKEYAKKNKRIRVYKQKNAGPGAARNKGAGLARGKILVFVDADMMFDKHYLRDLTKPIRSGKEIGTTHSKELVANVENIWARSWSINRVPEETAVRGCGVFRAVLKKEFLRVGGFDPSKGYFDDDLSALGLSKPTPATCYHNNPESLLEGFKHSLWVGKSLMAFHKTRKKYSFLVVGSWLGILALLIFGILRLWTVFCSLILIGFVLVALFLLYKSIPRAIQEKRPEYLFSIPILWTVRLTGFYIGATRELAL